MPTGGVENVSQCRFCVSRTCDAMAMTFATRVLLCLGMSRRLPVTRLKWPEGPNRCWACSLGTVLGGDGCGAVCPLLALPRRAGGRTASRAAGIRACLPCASLTVTYRWRCQAVYTLISLYLSNWYLKRSIASRLCNESLPYWHLVHVLFLLHERVSDETSLTLWTLNIYITPYELWNECLFCEGSSCSGGVLCVKSQILHR